VPAAKVKIEKLEAEAEAEPTPECCGTCARFARPRWRADRIFAFGSLIARFAREDPAPAEVPEPEGSALVTDPEKRKPGQL